MALYSIYKAVKDNKQYDRDDYRLNDAVDHLYRKIEGKNK
jgi:hypothetical protein